jgi:hypothetical protein
MTATSHSPVNTVMTEQTGQSLHMDTVGPSRVCSMGGKWYIFVIVDDYSRYSWVFFLETKMKYLNEYLNYLKAISSDNGTQFTNASFD